MYVLFALGRSVAVAGSMASRGLATKQHKNIKQKSDRWSFKLPVFLFGVVFCLLLGSGSG